MYKIYSRRRFLIKPLFENKNKQKKMNPKYKKLIVLVVILGVVIKMILNYFEPIFETMCEEKAKSIATIITNQQSTIIMNKYQYEELYTIEKDESGNIVIIKSNVVPINNMISDLTENIQNEFNDIEKTKINIPFGNLLGMYFFSGMGPNIPIQVTISGTLDTEIKSEFISQGINQTLHRVYVNFECNVKIVTPLKNYEKMITNQVIIAEHVIVGNIPDSYYNFDNIREEDTLNAIE